MKKLLLTTALIAATGATGAHAVDVTWSGFGSVGMGKVISSSPSANSSAAFDGTSGGAFLADYSRVEMYDENIGFAPDTTFGLQAKATINDKLSATIQIIASGGHDFEPDVDWAYISYEINDNLTFQAGRKRLPTFYYSDFYDIGYAYNWIRPPGDTYTWQIDKYNGFNLLHRTSLGGKPVTTNFYVGRENDKDNDFVGFLFAGAEAQEDWRDMVGVTSSIDLDWVEIRASIQDGEIQTTVPLYGVIAIEDYQFYGLSFNFRLGNTFLLSELQMQDRQRKGGNGPTLALDAEGYSVTLGHTFGDFTPYVTTSYFIAGNDDDTLHADTAEPAAYEEHSTLTAGIRWDFAPSVALKVQYDDFEDKSGAPVTGDSKLISASIDFIF